MDNNNKAMSASNSANSPRRKTKINYRLLPVKAHYFFFMACKY
jgi:hypothetical protein